jgi:hypothetical protein
LYRLTFRITSAGGGTWTLHNTEDLRQTNNVGGGASITPQQTFSDAEFAIFNTTDPTKIIDFDASGITTATTRTLSIPDDDGTIAITGDNSTNIEPLQMESTQIFLPDAAPFDTSKFNSQGVAWSSLSTLESIVFNAGAAERPELSWIRGARTYPEASIRQHTTADSGLQFYVGPGTVAPTLTMTLELANAIFGSSSGAGKLTINGAAASDKFILYQTGGVSRWVIRSVGTESGSDTGSDLRFDRRDDSGSFLDSPLTITRSTGKVSLANGTGVDEFSTDGTLAGNSDDAVPTEKAVKTYVDASGGASPLTTKGDIYTYSTVNARLPVGSNDQILVADSTETTGLKWIDNPRNLEFVEEKTFTSAATTTSFTSLTGTDRYYIEANLVNDAGSDCQYELRINGDSGSTDYFYQQLFVNGASVVGSRTANQAYTMFNFANDESLSWLGIDLIDGRLHVENRTTAWDAADTGSFVYRGVWKNTAGVSSITQIDIIANQTNGIGIDSRIRLYKAVT